MKAQCTTLFLLNFTFDSLNAKFEYFYEQLDYFIYYRNNRLKIEIK